MIQHVKFIHSPRIKLALKMQSLLLLHLHKSLIFVIIASFGILTYPIVTDTSCEYYSLLCDVFSNQYSLLFISLTLATIALHCFYCQFSLEKVRVQLSNIQNDE